MKKEDGTSAGDEDFVTKTNKSTRKKINKALSEENKDPSTGASSSEGISLRPRTMFTVKGRGQTEPETSPAYRPQWSKDGDGFVSNTPRECGENNSGERRKGKVLRYTKEELLALHMAMTPPSFPSDTVVTLEEPLPPVNCVPFDYDEIYKQWALNRNRGRGRGRTNGGTNERGNSSGRTDVKWEDTKWDGKSRRGEDRSNARDENRWERGASVETDTTKDDMWDDVGAEGGESMELDLSTMAAAAESFRKEMDAMRDQVRQMEMETTPTDMDEFDQKLEKAAAAGQFEDHEEEVQWDSPSTELEAPSDDNLTFSSFQMTLDPRDKQLSPPEKRSMILDEPVFALPTLSSNAFDLGSLNLEVEDEWFYLDPQNLQQGPFKTAEMREWFDAGYFKPNLPIRFGREGVFTPLANHFLQGQPPFASIPRPTPRMNEQQRIVELHRQQQQQQQQMLLLQQQQEQERIMQFNREEKIRLEMQRLEIARQQQNHLFQQQQMIHQQQQQQQLLLQQQQLQQQQQQQLQQQHLQQQQSSWQQSQRQGIMSALGMFGGGDQSLNESEIFPPDNRNPQLFQRPVSPVAQESNLVKLGNSTSQDPWGLNVNPIERPREVIDDISPFGGMQDVHKSPKTQTDVFADPWGKSKVVEKTPIVEHSHQLESDEAVKNTQSPHIGDSRETRREDVRSRPQTTEREKSTGEKTSKKEKTSSTSKDKSKQIRANEAEKSAWSSASKPVTSSAKSLKDIQEEEKLELNKTQDTNGEAADLASMGAQLKMMLGVNESAQPSADSPPKTSPVPPSTSPWGKTAIIAPPQNSSKSMREILAEEERLAAERAKRSDAIPTSSHWVNVVAGNTAPVVAPKAARIPVPSSVLKSTTRTRTSVSGEITVLKKTGTTPNKVENDASFWNFGAAQDAKSGVSASSSGVPSDFMAWCGTQIKNINGSEDLTLVEYCATLEDPGEIREYMAAYLGSTPKVSAFASEFIQRKKKIPSGGSKKQDADTQIGNANTSGTKKQNKRRTKGQKIDPSLLNYSVGS